MKVHVRFSKRLYGISALLLLLTVMFRTTYADDRNIGKNNVYLPVITADKSELQEFNVAQVGIPSDVVRDVHGRVVTPFDELPPCTDEMLAKIDWENLPSPDFKSPDIGCRALSTPQKNEGNLVIPIPVPGDNVLAAQTTAQAKAYAINKIYCPSGCTASNGIKSIEGNLSGKLPSLTSGVWSDYAFSNRMHFGKGTTTITCPGFTTIQNVSMGVVYGNFWGTTVTGSTMRVFWESFLGNNNCQGNLTNFNPAPNTALFMVIDRYDSAGSGHWRGRAWIGSWATIFDLSITNVTSDANYAEAGQEITAVLGNLSPMKVPLNFAHRLHLFYSGGLKPWHENALSTPLLNVSSWQVQAPWNALDLVGGDYTAIAVEANQ